MYPGLNFDEKLENDSLTACKKCFHILVRKPTYMFRHFISPYIPFFLDLDDEAILFKKTNRIIH